MNETRRERAGEYIEHRVGAWSARAYPGGRLSVTCAPLNINCHDFREVPAARVFELGRANEALVELLRLAGWSV
jgi:hypothetical protein